MDETHDPRPARRLRPRALSTATGPAARVAFLVALTVAPDLDRKLLSGSGTLPIKNPVAAFRDVVLEPASPAGCFGASQRRTRPARLASITFSSSSDLPFPWVRW